MSVQELEKSKKVFNIEEYKDSPDDIAFYTGFPDYQAFLFCYDIVKDSAKNISYNYDKIYPDLHMRNKPGRPCSLTTFQECTMTMTRLRLGLFMRSGPPIQCIYDGLVFVSPKFSHREPFRPKMIDSSAGSVD
jgi:hypothetical protein